MYYVLERFGAMYPCRWMGKWPFIRDVNWKSGRRHFQTIPDPLEFSLKPINPESSDHGPEMPELFKGRVLLFRDDLVDALANCGVDNLDLYNAVIIDPDSGQQYSNYKAVNIIGLIAAADMEKSEATVHPGGPPLIDVDFDSLVIDESKTHGALIFRLAESTNAILVHEKLKKCLLEKGFNKLEFLDPRECAL